MSKTKTVELRPTPKFIPPWTRGDREFDGHGPNVVVSARLSIKNKNQLWVTVYMRAQETRSDWTTAEGSQTYCVYDGRWEEVERITRIVSDTYSSNAYLDVSHEDDEFDLGTTELVSRFVITGDTEGDEAGSRTGVIAEFNPVQFEYDSVVEPQPVVTVRVPPLPKYVPPHVGSGDNDFGGHGPVVRLTASIAIQNTNEIWATIWMNAKETRSDWTEVSGSKSVRIYRHPTPIIAIVSDNFSSASYVDDGHEDDPRQMAAGDLVSQFIVTGDTKGDEAGSRTGVRVEFNPITIQVKKWETRISPSGRLVRPEGEIR